MITANERGRVAVKLDRTLDRLQLVIDLLMEEPNNTLTAKQVAGLFKATIQLLKKEFGYGNSTNSNNQ